MSELSYFLLARISEDEAAATRPCGEAHPEADVYCYPPEHPDPKRMAECDAKRRIVAQLGAGDPANRWANEAWRQAEEDVLRLLALPYADHPDYDERWRP